MYRRSNILIYDTNTSLKDFSSRVAGFLIHLHYSNREWTPVPRAFLESNGYERLTSMKCVDLLEEDIREHSSLYVLQYLDFIEVKPPSEGKCREYSLTPLGEAIVAGLGLFYKTKLPYKEVVLEPGDLTLDNKDYAYYEKVEGFIPDREVIDKFLLKTATSSVDLTSYVKGFKASCPLLSFDKDRYKTFIKEVYIAKEEFPQSIRDLKNFDRDLHLICAGKDLDRYTQGKSKAVNVQYNNVWRLSYTGRLFQRQGLQGISRSSKSLVHQDRYNYDIPNSQMRVLLQLVEDISIANGEDIDLTFLREYINNPRIREDILRDTNISKDDWKKMVYSMVFGSNLHNLHQKTSLGKVFFMYRGDPYFDKELLLEYLETLYSPIQYLFDNIRSYIQNTSLSPLQSSRLIGSVPEAEKYSIEANVQDYAYNGLVFIHKKSEIFKKEVQCASFYLQGLESSFILCLGELAHTANFSYEFDGLVVDRPIHIDLINEARRLSGFRYGDVIVKDFK